MAMGDEDDDDDNGDGATGDEIDDDDNGDDDDDGDGATGDKVDDDGNDDDYGAGSISLSTLEHAASPGECSIVRQFFYLALPTAQHCANHTHMMMFFHFRQPNRPP